MTRFPVIRIAAILGEGINDMPGVVEQKQADGSRIWTNRQVIVNYDMLVDFGRLGAQFRL